MLKLCLVFYGKHTPESDARIIQARPEYILANTTHGLWGGVYGYETWWLLHDVSIFRQVGIKVMGYITGGYEMKGSGGGLRREWYTLEINKKFIKNMAELDHVDGVFIDECSDYPDEASKQYLKELTDFAHSYGLMTWGNVGVDYFDPWYFTDGGFELMKSTEQWHGQSLNRLQKKWGHRISVTGFKPYYTAEDAVKFTVKAWKKGLAYCYICRGYTSLPPWFEEYVARLNILAVKR